MERIIRGIMRYRNTTREQMVQEFIKVKNDPHVSVLFFFVQVLISTACKWPVSSVLCLRHLPDPDYFLWWRFSSLFLYIQPKAVFFTCMDSRMIPTRFTETHVGDMFVGKCVKEISPWILQAEISVQNSAKMNVLMTSDEMYSRILRRTFRLKEPTCTWNSTKLQLTHNLGLRLSRDMDFRVWISTFVLLHFHFLEVPPVQRKRERGMIPKESIYIFFGQLYLKTFLFHFLFHPKISIKFYKLRIQYTNLHLVF